MKVQDFAYQVAQRVIELLEQAQHYKVTEEHRKQVLQQILSEVDALIKKST